MEKKMRLNTTQKIQLAGASLLLLCILPLPYGFYTIVRIVTTIISAYLAYGYYTQHQKGLAITFSIVAVTLASPTPVAVYLIESPKLTV